MFQGLLGTFRKAYWGRSERLTGTFRKKLLRFPPAIRIFCKKKFLHEQYHGAARVHIISHFARKIKLLSDRGLCEHELRLYFWLCSFLKTNMVYRTCLLIDTVCVY